MECPLNRLADRQIAAETRTPPPVAEESIESILSAAGEPTVSIVSEAGEPTESSFSYSRYT